MTCNATQIDRTFSLRLDTEHGPGRSWRMALTFKPLRNGFSVGGRLSAEDDEGISRIFARSAEPLSWRSAARWIAGHEEVHLGGDFLAEIQHDLPIAWQGRMLAWSWIEQERPYANLYESLLQCDDDWLTELLEPLGGDWSPSSQAFFESLWNDLDALGLLEAHLGTVFERLGLRRPATLVDVAERAGQLVQSVV